MDLHLAMMELRHRSRITTIANDSGHTSTLDTEAHAAPGQFTKLKDIQAYVTGTLKMQVQNKFTGEPDEPRAFWRLMIKDISAMVFPPGLPVAIHLGLFVQTLSDKVPTRTYNGRSESPAAYLVRHLQELDQMSEVRVGDNLNITLQTGVPGDLYQSWSDLLEENFPIIEPVTAAIKVLRTLEMTNLSKLDEYMRHWLICLDTIREREGEFETSDHHQGYYEEYHAAGLLGNMLGKLATRISNHMSAVYGQKGYQASDEFLQLWEKATKNAHKEKGRVLFFENMIRNVYRHSGDTSGHLTYTDPDGQASQYKKLRSFTWKEVPVRWLLQEVHNFWTQPRTELEGERDDNWVDHLLKKQKT